MNFIDLNTCNSVRLNIYDGELYCVNQRT